MRRPITVAPAARAARGLSDLSTHRLTRLVLVAAFALSVLALALLAQMEAGRYTGLALQVDERYFSVCAVRGNVLGEFPLAGCHDNKAPLIFLVHQIANLGGDPYAPDRVKFIGFATAVLALVLAARLAGRHGGPAGALIAATLGLAIFTRDSSLLALKTETLGMVFVLGGLLALVPAGAARQRWFLPCLLSGLLFGLAFVTKQTYALVALGLAAWLAVGGRADGARFGRVVVFLAGCALPFLAFLAVFLARGQAGDFLASFFLYPSIYGNPGEAGWASQIAWRLGAIAQAFSRVELLSLFTLVSLAMLLGVPRRPVRMAMPAQAALFAPLLIVAATLLAPLLLSPVFFVYHGVPPWLAMAMLSGAVMGGLWDRALGPNPSKQWIVALALVGSATLQLGTSWHSNGGRGRGEPSAVAQRVADRVADRAVLGAHVHYAYVLGDWPDFYIEGRRVAASFVQFPWAFSGIAGAWHFRRPPPGSWKGQLLATAQARAEQQLLADFRLTPPREILVMPAYASLLALPAVSAGSGLRDYLASRCAPMAEDAPARRRGALAFTCDIGAG